jgi:DNA replication protein DnaD
VWKKLKQRLKKRKARTTEQLQQFVQEEWDRITQDEIDREISKEVKALDQCIERHGDVTEF